MSSKTLWTARAVTKTAHEVKAAHMMERNADKQSRWDVRRNVTNDGVVSNLFKIAIDGDAHIHRYDLDASRQARPAANPAAMLAPVARKSLPVSPTRAWRMYAQALRRFPKLPALVRVAGRVYAATALPDELLELPKEYHDLGWEHCCLRPAGSDLLGNLTPAELKSVINKMLPYALMSHARKDGSFAVVRELDGKMVCTEDGISVAGLRIFRGTTASILHIRNGDLMTAVEDLTPVPSDTFLATITPDMTIMSHFNVRCKSVDRIYQFQGKTIGVYQVEDASGVAILQLWGITPDTMVAGQNYAIAGIKTKSIDPGQLRGATILVLLQGSMVTTKIAPLDLATMSSAIPGAGGASAGLALRLDTRCTVASEKSLWEEVRHHFGEGPYDEEKQRHITRAMQGTPVILSTNLKHTTVRSLRFDFVNPDEVPLDQQLSKLYGEIDRNQPYALVNDYSLVPLQALHCCYDPRMRSWQEVTVPACSFLPQRRNEVLIKFRSALKDGLRAFKVTLEDDALATKSLTLLAEPTKRPIPSSTNPAVGKPASIAASLGGGAAKATNENRPRMRTVLVVAITNPRHAALDIEKSNATMAAMGKYFRTQFTSSVQGEQEAVAFIDRTVMQNGRLNDPDTCVVFVSPDRETRASRWLFTECLRRGVLPVFIRGIAGERKQKLVAELVKLQLLRKLDTDPLRDSPNMLASVPLLANKNVLVVGVDTCHTHDITTGCVAGILLTPTGSHMFVQFWRNHIRGKEIEQVSDHFGAVVAAAHNLCNVDEVVVFQDGDVYSQLESMKARLPPNTNLSFLCLHKRTHIRFVHRSSAKKDSNVVKGAVVQALAPAATPEEAAQVPSFFLQCHDSFMSTARTVQYKVHHSSPQFPMDQLQQLAFVLAHVGSPAATKLPLPTRCAHRLSALAERLVDANPAFKSSMIPDPLSKRVWFL